MSSVGFRGRSYICDIQIHENLWAVYYHPISSFVLMIDDPCDSYYGMIVLDPGPWGKIQNTRCSSSVEFSSEMEKVLGERRDEHEKWLTVHDAHQT